MVGGRRLVPRGTCWPDWFRFPPAATSNRACGCRDRNQARALHGECSNWPRFLKPLYDPGRSDFPSPVLASALHAISQGGPSSDARNCGAGAPFAPTRGSLPCPFATMQVPRNPALCLERPRLSWPPSTQSPFARNGRYPRRGSLEGHLEGRYPLVVAHTGSCAKPPPSAHLGSRLARTVFAGSRQSLLGDGPSRHYLCDPCAGARTHTPPRSSAARVHSLTEDTGLTPRETGLARGSTPTWQLLRGAVFRGCSHSITFGLLHSLGPQTAPTAAPMALGRRAFHTTHRPAGYPNQDVASLHARHGQLAWLDSHQLDRSLVGCSFSHTALRRSSPPAFDYFPRQARWGRGATTVPARLTSPKRFGEL